MDMLIEIRHAITDKVHEQIDNLDRVDLCELEKAVEIIEELSEAIYYCTIVKAMHDRENDDEMKEAVVKAIQERV